MIVTSMIVCMKCACDSEKLIVKCPRQSADYSAQCNFKCFHINLCGVLKEVVYL